MITPESLKKGDKVALVAPAGKIAAETIHVAVKTLERWDLTVVPGRFLFDADYQYASTDRNRLEDLQQALDNPDIKAVLCARGGYGSIRLIDSLSFEGFCQHPKWIIGFSDITNLHAHIQGNYGIETLHATMAAGLTGDGAASDSLRSALSGSLLHYTLHNHPLSRKGSASGILTGGNLAILVSLLNSHADVDTKGKILFIEDVGENLYRIDRMCWTMKRAGKFSDLAGLVVGGMTDIPDTKDDFGKSAYEIVQEHVGEYTYPVCFGFPAGHQPDNRALILGRRATLTIANDTNLGFSAEKPIT